MAGVKRALEKSVGGIVKRLKAGAEKEDGSALEDVAPSRSSLLAEDNLLSLPKPRKSSNTFRCTYEGCDKSYNRPTRLEEHLRTHVGTRPFVCPEEDCKKPFFRKTHLETHVKSAHSNDRKFVCDWHDCDKRFVTAQKLRRHTAVHEKKEQFRCRGFPPCEETFRKHVTLKIHIDREHLRIKPFPCTKLDDATGLLCQRGFETAAKLRAHEGTYHGTARYWCSICDAVCENTRVGFPTWNDLRMHVNEFHPPQCEHCSKICDSLHALKQHVEINHSGISAESRKVVRCEWEGCGKTFTKVANLRAHVRSAHEKEKPFVCGSFDLSQSKVIDQWHGHNACGKAFAHKASLETHVRKQHLMLSIPKNRPKNHGRLSHLTGVRTQHHDNSMRCVASHCEEQFGSEEQAEMHAKLMHGMSGQEFAEAVVERRALSGGDFWLGGIDDSQDVDDDADLSEPSEWLEHQAVDVEGDVIEQSHMCSPSPTACPLDGTTLENSDISVDTYIENDYSEEHEELETQHAIDPMLSRKVAITPVA